MHSLIRILSGSDYMASFGADFSGVDLIFKLDETSTNGATCNHVGWLLDSEHINGLDYVNSSPWKPVAELLSHI